MNTDIKVSVIIVSYNTKELTINTIKSVIDKTENINYEIIVVDNDSKDGSVEELKKVFQSKITIIASKENLGFGRANNLGIKYANGEYFFLLNPDTELINNAIKIFYDYMEQNKQVGICGGNLYDKNNHPEASYFMYKDNIFSYFFWRYTELFTNIISLINKKFKFYYNFNYTDNPKNVGYVSGSDMFVRKTAIAKAGYFDENLFMYGDDNDICHRVKNSGYKIQSLSKVKVYHYGGKSQEFLGDKKYYIYFNGMYYYFFKYFGKKTYFIYMDNNLTFLRKSVVSLIFFNRQNSKKYFSIFNINKTVYKETKKIYDRKFAK